MDSSTLIYIVIGAFIIWVLFIREINPSNKTDAQLKWMHERASRNFMRTLKPSKELELISEEMEKRGFLNQSPQSLDTKDMFPNLTGIKRMVTQNVLDQMTTKANKISREKNISQQEALIFVDKLVTERTQAYLQDGLSEDIALKKAMIDTVLPR